MFSVFFFCLFGFILFIYYYFFKSFSFWAHPRSFFFFREKNSSGIFFRCEKDNSKKLREDQQTQTNKVEPTHYVVADTTSVIAETSLKL